MDAGGVMSGFAVALNAMDQTHVHALALRRMIFITMVPNNLRIARYVRIPYYIISTDYYILLCYSWFFIILFHNFSQGYSNNGRFQRSVQTGGCFLPPLFRNVPNGVICHIGAH